MVVPSPHYFNIKHQCSSAYKRYEGAGRWSKMWKETKKSHKVIPLESQSRVIVPTESFITKVEIVIM